MNRAIKRKIFSQKPKPNITFMGLGGIGLTKAQFVEDTNLSVNDIRSWAEDENGDLHLSIARNFSLYSFGGGSNVGNGDYPVRDLINANITGINDYNGLIKTIDNWTLANHVKQATFNLQGLTTIFNEGFRNLRNVTSFAAPNLSSVGNAGLANLANNNPYINFDCPLVSGNFEMGVLRVIIQTPMPLVTGGVTCRFARASFFPFPNASSTNTNGFRDTQFQGVWNLPNFTYLNGLYNFLNARFATEIIMPNVTAIGRGASSFANTNELEVLDIRGVTSWGNGNGDDAPTGAFGTSSRNNLTIHANTALQTSGVGGTMNQYLLDVQSRGATIIWHT